MRGFDNGATFSSRPAAVESPGDLNVMDVDWRTEVTRQGNRVTLAGSSVAMHCHHYNINLQTMLEETLGRAGVELMFRAAELSTSHGFRTLLARYPQIRTVKSKIELAETLHQTCGMGLIHFREAGANLSRAESVSSHHVTGWLAKHGRRTKPGCHFTRGWIAGILSVLFGGEYDVIETSCKLVEGNVCEFIAKEKTDGH